MRRFSSGEEVEVWCIKTDNLLHKMKDKIKLVNDGAAVLAAGLMMVATSVALM